MIHLRIKPLIAALLLSWCAACGSLQVGIESTPEPVPSATVAFATQTPNPAPSAAPTGGLTPTPQATGALAPITRERINFAPGGTAHTLLANLAPGLPKGYVLGISAQQEMTITAGAAVSIVVLDPEGGVLEPTSQASGQWQGVMPETGDYTILLTGQGQVSIKITIPPRP